MRILTWSLAIVGVLAASPAMVNAQAKDDPVDKVRLAAARLKSSNNLRQIALAFHNTESATRSLPRDITDKAGKPLLSWRVAILPYIEQENLYKQFKLNEPWDSENNKKLLDKMPTIYAPPIGKSEKGHTFYQAFNGPGALMGGKPVSFAGIADGSSNSIMLVEAGEAVEWTKPADVPFDPKKPLPKLGGIFDGAFNVAMCDGTVRFVQKGVNTENVKKFITINGGETVEDKDLQPQK